MLSREVLVGDLAPTEDACGDEAAPLELFDRWVENPLPGSWVPIHARHDLARADVYPSRVRGRLLAHRDVESAMPVYGLGGGPPDSRW